MTTEAGITDLCALCREQVTFPHEHFTDTYNARGLEREVARLRRALTARERLLRDIRDGLICTRQAPHAYDANHYCANCGSDHARLKDAIDAAMEKSNG